ncbi:MAG: pirin family protein [Acidobacteriota bacterium]|jgi:quercetin 2,3-dioxygenase
MITLRKGSERGHFNHGWLDTYHTFSFDQYFDPDHMGFRELRVINEDRVAPDRGFPMHPHRDMEIITVVLEGTLAHKDSMGNGSEINPGDVQRMSAGTGVTHSEFNPSKTDPVHLLQIWILPSRTGLKPSYEQKTFPAAKRENRLQLIASPEGAEGSVTIHQDALLHSAVLDSGQKVEYELLPDRHAWVQVADGRLLVNGQPFSAGDGAAVSGEERLDFEALEDASFLLFDLA